MRLLFKKIVEAYKLSILYLSGLMGFSTYQKITTAMRMIVYDIPTGYVNEYLRISEDTTIESVTCLQYYYFILVLDSKSNDVDVLGWIRLTIWFSVSVMPHPFSVCKHAKCELKFAFSIPYFSVTIGDALIQL